MKTTKNKKLDFIDVFSKDNVSFFTKHNSLDKNGNEKNIENTDKKELLSDEKTYLSIGWI